MATAAGRTTQAAVTISFATTETTRKSASDDGSDRPSRASKSWGKRKVTAASATSQSASLKPPPSRSTRSRAARGARRSWLMRPGNPRNDLEGVVAGTMILPVALVAEREALERQHVVALVDRTGLRGDEGREPARADDARREIHLGLDAVDDGVDEARVTEDEARLHARDRVAADGDARAHDLDARQLGGRREERAGRDGGGGRAGPA